MEPEELVAGDSWEDVLALLPEGYEEAAFELEALQRRRQIQSAGDLLRLAMAYSVCDLSLRLTAGWASLQGLAELSDVAVLKRLRAASDWLGWLVVRSLSEGDGVKGAPRHGVRILDASVVSEPGARGTNWRVHLGLDLVRETIQSVELRGPEGGETLVRHTIIPEEILVVDRGYAHRRGVAHVLEHEGHVVVWLNWQNFPVEDAEGRPIALPDALESLGVEESCDRDVWFRDEGRRYKVRLVAYRKTLKPTERDRREIRRRAKRKKRRADPRTLLGSCFVMLVTDLPREEVPAEEVLALYRLRWRVETAFKRLKSLLRLDQLRAHDPQLVAAYIHAKLLAAILLERLSEESGTESFSPWGGIPEETTATESLEGHPLAHGESQDGDPGDTELVGCCGSVARPHTSPLTTGRGNASRAPSPPFSAQTPYRRKLAPMA